MRISPRYFTIELITGLIFTGTYYLFFKSGMRAGIPAFSSGGWILYLITIIMVSALIASSAIDLELWVIPLSVCWIVTIAGIITSGVAPLLIDIKVIRGWNLLPQASVITAALGTGATAGLRPDPAGQATLYPRYQLGEPAGKGVRRAYGNQHAGTGHVC